MTDGSKSLEPRIDLFESTVNLEEQLLAEGHADGKREGKIKGYRDGINLGVDKGFEIGSEVGFYIGAVQSWIRMQEHQPGYFSERNFRSISSLEELLSKFPTDPQDEMLQDALDDVRGKFKACVVSMGAKHAYFPETQSSDSSLAF